MNYEVREALAYDLRAILDRVYNTTEILSNGGLDCAYNGMKALEPVAFRLKELINTIEKGEAK